MAVGASLAGDHAHKEGLVQTDRLRRSQILRDKDRRLGALHGTRIRAHQEVQGGLLQIVHVRASRLHVGIIHGLEDLSLVVKRDVDCILCGALLVLDDLLDGIHQVVIFHHHSMDLEDSCTVLARSDLCLLTQHILLGDDLLYRFVKTCDLSFRIIDDPLRDLKLRCLIDLDLCNCDSVQNAFTGSYLHILFLLQCKNV